MKHRIEDWLGEMEGYSLKVERFISDTEIVDEQERFLRMKEWLKAAYDQGRADARDDEYEEHPSDL